MTGDSEATERMPSGDGSPASAPPDSAVEALLSLTAAETPPGSATAEPERAFGFGAPVDFANTAIRPGYGDLPKAVRRYMAAELGADPVEVLIAGGGFTTGFAARIRAASGAAAFVKAAGPSTPEVRDAYRMEARYTAALPRGVPAPSVLFHAELDDWSVTGYEALQGDPLTLPMRPETLDLLLDTWATAARALNPPPPDLIACGIRPKTAENLSFFQNVADGSVSPIPLPPKLDGRWTELAEIEAGIDRILLTDQVTHGDLRPDNFVLGREKAWICDWSKPRYVPPWVDTVNVLIVANGDGHDVERRFWSHPTSEGVTGDELDSMLAAITGALLDGWDDAPRRIVSPLIHDHMRWAALAAADWLALRRGW